MALRHIKLVVGNKQVGIAHLWSYDKDDGNIYVLPTYHITVSGTDDHNKPASKNFECIRFGVLRKSERAKARVAGWTHTKYWNTIKMWEPGYRVQSAGSPENGAWNITGNFLIHDGPDDPTDRSDPFGAIGCVEICGPQGFIKFNDYIISLSGSKATSRNAKLKQIADRKRMKVFFEHAPFPPLKISPDPPKKP
ncbi:MAG: hypothetical protein QNJ40_26350 [Xanthomonadales bacterium]|nr:hypothetical protein [Xanthomonadales bacterium]